MNRNLFLLAAALQLPVALWMQGCGKDEETTDDKTEDPAHGSDEKPPSRQKTPPVTHEDVEPLSKGRDMKDRFQRMLEHESITFPKDAAGLYDPKVAVTTATFLTVDSIAMREAEDKKRRGEPKFFAWTHAELVEEFSAPNADREIEHKQSRFHPGVVTSDMVQHFTEDFDNYVVLDSTNSHFVQGSAASFVIAQNVAPVGKEIDNSEWNLVAEVYTARESNPLFPRSNPHNLMTVMMPYSDVANTTYDIAYKAFMMVLFHNVVVTADAQQDQQFLVAKYNNLRPDPKDKITADVFEWYENTHKDRDEHEKIRDLDEFLRVTDIKKEHIRLDDSVGASHKISKSSQNKAMIDSAKSSIIKHTKEFREQIQELVRDMGASVPENPLNGAPKGGMNVKDDKGKWHFKKWDLKYYSHFESWVGYALHLQHGTVQEKLENIRIQLDILYGCTDAYNTAKATDGEFAKIWTHKFLEQQKSSTNKEGEAEFIRRQSEPHLTFPQWFLQNLFTLDRDVLPKDAELFDDFRLRTNDDHKTLNKEQADEFPYSVEFVVPTFKYANALESYIISAVTWGNPGHRMHSEHVKATCLGIFDAFEQANSRQTAVKDLGKNFLLGDISTMNSSRNKQNKWYKNEMGPSREMPELKKEHIPKTLSFFTTEAQIKAEVVDIETIIRESADEKIIEIDVKEKLIVKEEAYKPVKAHRSRNLTMAPAA